MSESSTDVKKGNVTDSSVLKEYFAVSDKMSLFYLVASVTGVFLILLLCVVVMLVKNRNKHKPPKGLFLSDIVINDGRSTCKSAPLSRNGSPTREKRKSCPSVYGAFDEGIVRSSTFDSLPSLETERVQPSSEGEKSKSVTALQYQASFLGAHAQVPAVRNDSDLTASGSASAVTALSDYGRLFFTVLYDSSSSTLLVTLVKVKELKGRSTQENHRDPFVKIYLLPAENICYTSKVVKKSLNPVYNETFQFVVDSHEISHKGLRFSVYDVDRRRLRHTLGHVVVSLRDLNLSSSEVLWRDLQQEINYGSSVAEVNLALTYLPHTERLKLVILRARSIRPNPDRDTGFYVRIHLYYGNKLVKTKQTLTQLPLPEVNFNESFAFSTSNKNIENFNFVVTLVKTDRQTLSGDVELGHVTLGSFMYARGAGLIHWQEMLAKTRNVVTKWHQLNVPV